MVHPVAAEGFVDADCYERGRPDYAPEAVDWLVEQLELEPGDLVADVAAGTGKLTRPLGDRGLQVVPVEPLAAMFEPLVSHRPTVVQALAERLPFRDRSFDAVTVGQGMHWFDKERAAAEFGRVLRTGGRMGLIWNARDRTDPFVDDLWSIMDAVEKRAPWRNHEAPVTHDIPGFGEATHRHFASVQRVDRNGVHDRFLSVSHVAALPPDQRADVIRSVDETLDHHFGSGADHFEIPYRVDAYWLEPLS